jgi:hypothetical protein
MPWSEKFGREGDDKVMSIDDAENGNGNGKVNDREEEDIANYDDYVERRVTKKIRKAKAAGIDVTGDHIEQWGKEAAIAYEVRNAKPNDSMKNGIVDCQTHIKGKRKASYDDDMATMMTTTTAETTAATETEIKEEEEIAVEEEFNSVLENLTSPSNSNSNSRNEPMRTRSNPVAAANSMRGKGRPQFLKHEPVSQQRIFDKTMELVVMNKKYGKETIAEAIHRIVYSYTVKGSDLDADRAHELQVQSIKDRQRIAELEESNKRLKRYVAETFIRSESWKERNMITEQEAKPSTTNKHEHRDDFSKLFKDYISKRDGIPIEDITVEWGT